MTGNYGNSADYLVRRIARDRPDILEDMKAGKYVSVRAAARDAGIIRVVPTELKGIEQLLEAWSKADLEDRQLFLGLVDEEIEAAYNGKYINKAPKRIGPDRWEPLVEIPELEFFIDSVGGNVSEAARQLEVTRRTVARWRSGESKPSQANLDKLRDLTDAP